MEGQSNPHLSVIFSPSDVELTAEDEIVEIVPNIPLFFWGICLLFLAPFVRSLIEDIRDVGFHKVETGLKTISGGTHAVKLKNLSAMEVNIVRLFMVRTLQAFYKHDSPKMIQQKDNAGSKALSFV